MAELTDTLEVDTSANFQSQAAAVLRQLRTKLNLMFGKLPGGIRKSRDVQKNFGVDARLSWQIFKLAGPGDVMALAQHVPSGTSMRRLIAAARDHGIPSALLNEVSEAFDAFEALVETHAGDRSSFDSMARGFSDHDNNSQADLHHRKALFKGHSHYYGVQTQTMIVTQIIHPGDGANIYDCLHLRSRFGQRRLRPDADVIVDTFRASSKSDAKDLLRWEVLDEEASQRYHAPILPEFSTRPLPDLRTTRHPDGMSVTELVGDAVGRTSAVDLVFGQIIRGGQQNAQKTIDPSYGSQVAIAAPTALVILDFLVHEPSFPRLTFDFNVYAYGSGPDLHARQPRLKLPFHESVVSLGAGADSALVREAPRYCDLLDYACRKVSWKLAEMQVYRAAVEFPILNTFPTITAASSSIEITDK